MTTLSKHEQIVGYRAELCKMPNPLPFFTMQDIKPVHVYRQGHTYQHHHNIHESGNLKVIMKNETGTPLANCYPSPPKERKRKPCHLPPCNHNYFVPIYLSMYEKLSNAERGNGTHESVNTSKGTQASSHLQLVLDA